MSLRRVLVIAFVLSAATVAIPSAADVASDAPAPVACSPAEKCCRICSQGKVCGKTCIQATKTGHVGRGCACNTDEVCGASSTSAEEP